MYMELVDLFCSRKRDKPTWNQCVELVVLHFLQPKMHYMSAIQHIYHTE